jgi:DNA-binding transcriptional ArsR family regulator
VDAVRLVTEPRRREILRLVWDEERSAGEIARRFDVGFPAVSQPLRLLRDHGLVTVRRQGTSRYYRADRAALAPLAPLLEAMWAAHLDRLADLAEGEQAGR